MQVCCEIRTNTRCFAMWAEDLSGIFLGFYSVLPVNTDGVHELSVSKMRSIVCFLDAFHSSQYFRPGDDFVFVYQHLGIMRPVLTELPSCPEKEGTILTHEHCRLKIIIPNELIC